MNNKDLLIKATHHKPVFVAWTNTDLTEGRGRSIPLVVSESRSLVTRLGKGKNVQGSNATITEEDIYFINNLWYGPCNLAKPTKEDIEIDKNTQKEIEVIKKAKEAGLSEEDILILTGIKS